MFQFRHDPSGRVLIATNSGFWNLEEAISFAAELRISVEHMRKTGSLRLLIDSSASATQPGAVIDALATAWKSLETFPADRVAVVSPSALKKLQAKRIFGTLDIAFFHDQSEALSWLMRPKV